MSVLAGQPRAAAPTRHRAVPDWALPWIGILVVLTTFELVSRTGVVSSRNFPPVSEMFARARGPGGRPRRSGSSVWNTLQGWALGLGIATLISIPLGILLGASRLLYRALRGVIEFLRPIPSVALIPLAVLVYGTGLESKVFLAAFAATWPLLLQTIYGVQDVDPVATDTARSFGFSRAQRLRPRHASERGPLHRHRCPDLLVGRAHPRRHRRDRDRRARPRARCEPRATGRRVRPDVRPDHRHRPPRVGAQRPASPAPSAGSCTGIRRSEQERVA